MATEREALREELEKSQKYELLSQIETKRHRLAQQIEQLRGQIVELTKEKLELDSQWREEMLKAQATVCPKIGEDGKKPGKKVKVSKAIEGLSPSQLAEVAKLLNIS